MGKIEDDSAERDPMEEIEDDSADADASATKRGGPHRSPFDELLDFGSMTLPPIRSRPHGAVPSDRCIPSAPSKTSGGKSRFVA
ncbi:hypothetical protein Cni_G06142 [Canna indica]|uniref:Uncharacterized protein n=1 Tax=Canna indica TaxID=4628 RepID=A0AAQ3Q688_9LILI|nr:hypothetical protein Cni_G06142 [Canna indica]